MRVIVVKWKRIESQKKELATHNSFEKELKESILQLSTPESLLLYKTGNKMINVFIDCVNVMEVFKLMNLNVVKLL